MVKDEWALLPCSVKCGLGSSGFGWIGLERKGRKVERTRKDILCKADAI